MTRRRPAARQLVRVVAAWLLAATFVVGSLVRGSSPSEAAAAVIRRPVDVMVIVDSSKRDIPFHFTAIQRIAGVTVRTLPRDARIGLVTTGPFPTVIRPLSSERVGVISAISGLRADGRAPLFDAISLAIDQFDDSTWPVRTIVVVGDARSTGNNASLAEVSQLLSSHKVTIDFVTVGIGKPNEPLIHALLGPKSSRVDDKHMGGLNRSIAANSEVSLKTANSRHLHIPKSGLIGLGAVMLMASVGVLAFLLSGTRSTKLNAQGAVVVGSEGATPVAELSERLSGAIDRSLERQGRHSALNLALEAAGVSLRPGEFVLMIMSVVVTLGGFAYVSKGLIGGAVGVVLASAGGFYVLRFKARRRRTAFGTQLGDVLQLLSSSMRAGQSLIQALDAVAREAESPAAEEFRRVIVETRLGRDLVESLHALSVRMECEDLRWVIPAIEINRSVGGDLGEVLDNVGKTIRDRADIRRQVKTLSAEGRMSAWVLLGMPVALGMFLYTSNRDYIGELFHGVGLYMLGGGVVLMIVGTFWMLTLCKIKF